MTPQESTAVQIAAAHAVSELFGAMTKFPGATHTHAALGEEVGELAKALIESDRGKCGPEEVYAEAMQVAAMALRIAIFGSEEFDYRFDPAYAQAFCPLGSKTKELEPAPEVEAPEVEAPEVEDTLPQPAKAKSQDAHLQDLIQRLKEEQERRRREEDAQKEEDAWQWMFHFPQDIKRRPIIRGVPYMAESQRGGGVATWPRAGAPEVIMGVDPCGMDQTIRGTL